MAWTLIFIPSQTFICLFVHHTASHRFVTVPAVFIALIHFAFRRTWFITYVQTIISCPYGALAPSLCPLTFSMSTVCTPSLLSSGLSHGPVYTRNSSTCSNVVCMSNSRLSIFWVLCAIKIDSNLTQTDNLICLLLERISSHLRLSWLQLST